MADRPDPFPSDEELAQALAAKLKLCPMCQGAEWHTDRVTVALPTQDGTDGALHVEPADDNPNAFDIEGTLALPVVCGKCGFIALFHLRRLLSKDTDAAG